MTIYCATGELGEGMARPANERALAPAVAGLGQVRSIPDGNHGDNLSRIKPMALSVVVEPVGPGSVGGPFVFFRVQTLARWADRHQHAERSWRVVVHEVAVSHSFECRTVELAARCRQAGLS